ncbi:hypothetical protein C8Q72DRAFT_519835 [Fomitopsis betulina]|nr:hypothetical protein C8Q72DRAFT_519835 [Fomitopsis betulina]
MFKLYQPRGEYGDQTCSPRKDRARTDAYHRWKISPFSTVPYFISHRSSIFLSSSVSRTIATPRAGLTFDTTSLSHPDHTHMTYGSLPHGTLCIWESPTMGNCQFPRSLPVRHTQLTYDYVVLCCIIPCFRTVGAARNTTHRRIAVLVNLTCLFIYFAAGRLS